MKVQDIYDEGDDAGWDEGHGVGYNEDHDDGLKDGLFLLVEKKIISVGVDAQEAHMTKEEFLTQMKARKEQ